MNHGTVELFISALVLIGQIVAMLITLKVFLNTPIQSKREKRRLLLLFFSFIALVINGFAFYTFTYAFQKDITNISTWGFLSFYLPYLFWLLLTGTTLLTILIPDIFRFKELCKILVVFMPLNLVVIFLFFLSKGNDASISSGLLHLQSISCACELMLFDLILLCLICLENLGFRLLLSGIAIIISSTFLFDISSHQPTTMMPLYGELFWLFGMILILTGLLRMQKKNFAKDQFRKITTIKGKLVLWTFGISMISFIFFFVFAYFFSLINKLVFTGLPFFIITYSLVAVLSSIFIGKYFETPFKKLADNIGVFMLNKDKNKIQNQFSIEEFVFLQKFILNVFEINEEKNRIKKQLGLVAVQVAHDIRSPLSVLQTIANNVKEEISKQEYDMICTALNGINTIANNLVGNYKRKKCVQAEITTAA